ncbi:MAG TPA: threonine synthase [Candidatus Coproplasma excrementigallinarum]|uniref:Threonine synthase n=1 Tax=Candidatus Coproplasma excrementigallinarum TaxID=2840747 RepID=A0A9D1SIF0_9FIRM|nr:threonine synthase [Candidatus Coproplasma excrementigallinarum]
MNFISTRGGEKVTGAQAIVKGLAEDGGLFVPEKFPQVTREELEGMLSMSYPERAAAIIGRYLDEYDGGELLSALEAAYSKFEGDPAPLVKIEENIFMLELWHGPTCAFKDMALTVLPYLLRKGCDLCGIKDTVLILVATSGDTGKAALEGFKDAEGVKIMVFYPDDGVSKMQKLQMCTQEGSNVDVLAVKGNFDDCQSAVKQIFSSEECAKQLAQKHVILSSANSINFGRLVPQIAYYFSAYLDMVSGGQIEMGEQIDFTVPTGNFGNILAAYYAKKMGLPIRRLHCASNLNNVLTDFLSQGVYDIHRPFYKTTSPSMDILISSNLERLLFEICGRDSARTAALMQSLKDKGEYKVTDEERARIAETFDGGFANEDEVVETIYDLFLDTGYTMDTHTGCAMKVVNDWFYKNKKDTIKMVVVSTANPYKFPQDVLYAVTGNDVKDSFKGIKRLHAATAMAVPKSLSALRDKPVRFTKTVKRENLFEEILQFVQS